MRNSGTKDLIDGGGNGGGVITNGGISEQIGGGGTDAIADGIKI